MEAIPPRRVDIEARRELAAVQEGRRSFLKKTAIGAGILALGAGLGYQGGVAKAVGLSGNTRTVITDTEIAARVIAGVRIATEFIPDPVPAGTDADPYPGSAIQAALDDGLAVYIPSGTWRLTSTISRAADNVTLIGAGKSTKLVLNGATSCISAGTQSGWLIANLSTDAGGVDLSSASQSRITEIWRNGVLVDNRPLGVGAGGFYGVRAADYVASGDGSLSNPYNADAIQSAISALPPQGGIVFIKSGIWRGTARIQVPQASGTSNKHVVLIGEGTVRDEYGNDANGHPLYGTVIEAGFDIYAPCDIFDMAIAPHPNNWKAQPCLKFVIDPTRVFNQNVWIGGFSLKRLLLFRGNPCIWFTGTNMGANFWQSWNILWEQLTFVDFNGGIKVDQGDSTAPSAGFRGRWSELLFHGGTGGNRAIDFSVSNATMTWSNFLIEGAAAGADYGLWLRTYGDGGGVEIKNVDFGDASGATKDAYIFIGSQGRVQGLEYSKDVDIGGRGYFLLVSRKVGTSPTPVFNIIGGNGPLIIEESPGGSGFLIGSTSGANRDQVRLCPSSPPGYLGTTTPTASPYTYQNLDMYDEVVYLVGGTISDVSRNGQSIGTDGSHRLGPGESIVISYTSAPTIKRFAGL